jgi:DNA polymerase elongation subunit (family B)
MTYQNIFIERGEGYGTDTVHLWDDQLGYKTVPFKNFDYAYKPDRGGNYISMTGVKLAKVKRYKRDDPSLFESDLPQETRVLTDLYLNEDTPSIGHKVMFFDIEVSMENGIPTVVDPNNEITAIALYDSATQEYSVLVLDKSGTAENYTKDGVVVNFYHSELDLLYAFLDLYEQIGPTIITGWNSDQFDVPYLYNRIRQQCGSNTAGRMSPIGKMKWSNFRKKYQIAGVSALDYLDLYKKFTYSQQPNYRLDSIGRLELNMGKIEYEGSLDDLFKNDIHKFIEYNLQDVRIIVEMDKKLKLIELVRGICHIGHVQYEDYCYSSKFLEGTIVTYLHRKDIIVTNKPAGGREMMDQRMENDEEGFSGAFVKEPTPGLYDWIYSLDLQSLYPSIIMSLNISPETKIGFVTNWDVDKHNNEQMTDYLIRGTNDEEVVRLTREAFLKYMKMENLTISSNGVLYNGNRMGIIPEVLDRWFAERVEYKNLMKKYKNEGNDELAEFYDRRQHIQKIFLNSLYGVLGLPIFRFFDIDNALAVTASGQDVIKNSAKFVNDLYWSKLEEQNDYCTYIDTDSLYFSASPLMPENADGKTFTIKLARAMEKKLNEYSGELAKDLFFCDSHRFYIKGESVATTGIWIAKKRYAMNVVYDLESNMDVDNKMKVKGLDVVRSSFPPAFRDFMKGMMKDVLNKATKDEVDRKVLMFRDQLSTMGYLEVARNTAVKNISEYDNGAKKLGDFKKGTPAHVKAALSYNSLLTHFGIDNRYESIEDGAKIKWVYLAQNPYNLDAVAVKGYNDPPEIIELVKQYIDYTALFENELQKKLQDFYNALKWGNIPTQVNQNSSLFFEF